MRSATHDERAIVLRLSPGEIARATPPGWRHDVAGLTVLSDVALPALAPFCNGRAALPRPTAPDRPGRSDPRSDTPHRAVNVVYRASAAIGATDRDVTCARDATAYRLSIAGVAEVAVAVDGGEIVFASHDLDPASDLLAEVALGPALVLALALRGVFCLHAAAVRDVDGAVAMLGASGSGKSTLAGHLSARWPDRWARIADDILPVAAACAVPTALPRFPQLKLPAAAQALRSGDRRVPLAAIYVLDRPRARDGDEPTVSASRVAPSEATVTLVRHTAAVRLFDRDLSRRHVLACAALAARVPLLRLRYPHGDGTREAASAIVARGGPHRGSD